jgi:hypothetical protein
MIMLALVIMAATSVPTQIFIYFVGALLLAGVTYVGASLRARQTRKRKVIDNLVKSNAEKDAKNEIMLRELHEAVVGRHPCSTEPYPPPGLVRVVPALVKDVAKIKGTLFNNGGRGNTILDRMTRNEESMKKIKTSVEKIAAAQGVKIDDTAT